MIKFEALEKCSDEELIDLYKNGNSDAVSIIMDRYRNLVKKRARTMYIMGGDSDDLIQEGMIGLYKAVTSFDKERYSSFAAFADICVTNRINTAIESSSRKKHGPLNSYISFYTDDKEFEDLINNLTVNTPGPEQLLINNEMNEKLIKTIDEVLSSLEKKVLYLYLEGLSYSQISEKIEKTEKSIDNAIQRIRTKLRNALLEGSNR